MPQLKLISVEAMGGIESSDVSPGANVREIPSDGNTIRLPQLGAESRVMASIHGLFGGTLTRAGSKPPRPIATRAASLGTIGSPRGLSFASSTEIVYGMVITSPLH